MESESWASSRNLKIHTRTKEETKSHEEESKVSEWRRKSARRERSEGVRGGSREEQRASDERESNESVRWVWVKNRGEESEREKQRRERKRSEKTRKLWRSNMYSITEVT